MIADGGLNLIQFIIVEAFLQVAMYRIEQKVNGRRKIPTHQLVNIMAIRAQVPSCSWRLIKAEKKLPFLNPPWSFRVFGR